MEPYIKLNKDLTIKEELPPVESCYICGKLPKDNYLVVRDKETKTIMCLCKKCVIKHKDTILTNGANIIKETILKEFD